MLDRRYLKFPAPYFGGKSRIAPLVWRALGDVRHYMEPFAGSAAVLLLRPNYKPGYHVETINDADGYIANVWRALQFAPDEVARWCDWPVHQVDLAARRHVLIANKERLLENLVADPKWYDAELAGYWIWCASCWVGGHMTEGPVSPKKRPHLSTSAQGVHCLGQIPRLGHAGEGVHGLGQIPSLSRAGQGVHGIGQIPHLGHAGEGVHALANASPGNNGNAVPDVREPYSTNIYTWFRVLSERLRYVRIVCGDWTKVCGGNWQDHIGTVGIFFDPPYGVEDRSDGIYNVDSRSVAHDVRRWCIERGDRPTYRIVLAGYDEHEELANYGWTKVKWKAGVSYGQRFNRFRETLWLSPHCIREPLFELLEENT